MPLIPENSKIFHFLDGKLQTPDLIERSNKTFLLIFMKCCQFSSLKIKIRECSIKTTAKFGENTKLSLIE